MEIEEAYKNLEDIISQGFLTKSFSYNELYCVIKNITDKEYRSLTYMFDINNRDNQYPLYKLAYSTFMVNGVNYLEDRNGKIQELLKFYKDTPSIVIQSLLECIEDIHYQYIEAVECLEGFCYTDKSRYLWKVMNNNAFPKINTYGLKGLDNIGINSVQENWIIINSGLDREEEFSTQFDLSLMIASSLNSKGAKSISSSYEAQKKEVKDVREEIAKYGYDIKRVLEGKKKNKWSMPLNTREDMVRELNRQMRGEKDQHDLFMEKWYKLQKDKAEAAQKAAEDKQKEYRQRLDTMTHDDMIEGSRPISSEELEKKLKNKEIIKGLSQSSDSFEKSENKKHFLRKIGISVIK